LYFDSKRYFLRGRWDFDAKYDEIYTDIIPYVQEIVSKSSDMFVMEIIPPTKNKIGRYVCKDFIQPLLGASGRKPTIPNVFIIFL